MNLFRPVSLPRGKCSPHLPSPTSPQPLKKLVIEVGGKGGAGGGGVLRTYHGLYKVKITHHGDFNFKNFRVHVLRKFSKQLTMDG